MDEPSPPACDAMQAVIDLHEAARQGVTIGEMINVIRFSVADLNSVRALQIPLAMFTLALQRVEGEMRAAQKADAK